MLGISENAGAPRGTRAQGLEGIERSVAEALVPAKMHARAGELRGLVT